MKNNFYRLDANNGVSIYKNKMLERYNFVNHAFSTRIGGVSKNAYSSLNLGVNTDDDKRDVLNNFKLFAEAIGTDVSKMVLSHQVHSANIRVVGKEDCGKGILRESDIKEVDGLITAEKGIVLATFYADCTPLLVLDTKNHVIASVHSGWRGTLSKIAQKAVLKMKDEFNSSPSDLICVTGPSIKQCHFEVGEEVYYEFKAEFGKITDKCTTFKNNKYYINTDALNYESLTNVGVSKENIDICPICTYCNKDMFFSHRGDGGKTGRMCAVIELI